MDDPLRIEDIKAWLRSKQQTALDSGVHLEMLGVPTFVTDKPGRGCDFFTDERYGRIGFWVSGEVDFEVIRCDDSSGAFFEHATVDRVALLDEPFSRFLAAVRGCDQGRFSRKIGQSASRERN